VASRRTSAEAGDNPRRQSNESETEKACRKAIALAKNLRLRRLTCERTIATFAQNRRAKEEEHRIKVLGELTPVALEMFHRLEAEAKLRPQDDGPIDGEFEANDQVSQG
jgi:hypothetical protein